MEYTNSQIRELISEYIHSERDRAILTRRLIDGITIEKLSEEFGITPRRLWTVIRENEEILFRHVE